MKPPARYTRQAGVAVIEDGRNVLPFAYMDGARPWSPLRKARAAVAWEFRANLSKLFTRKDLCGRAKQLLRVRAALTNAALPWSII